MKTISVFNYVTIDGYFAGPNGEIDWFKDIVRDEEWEKYSRGRALLSASTLMFGRVTYQMMKSYWPAANAMESDPEMAKVLNMNPKIVFSSTLNENAEEGQNWKNIRVFKEINPDGIRKIKEKENVTILGSGSIVLQLANFKLIDDYSLVMVPIILGSGKSLFKGVAATNLELAEAKSFKNGIVSLRYLPAKGEN